MNRRGDRKFRPQVTLGQLYVLNNFYIRGGGGGGVVEGRGRGGERGDLRRFWAVIADIIHKFIKHFTPQLFFCKKRVTKNNNNKNISTG